MCMRRLNNYLENNLQIPPQPPFTKGGEGGLAILTARERDEVAVPNYIEDRMSDSYS